MSSETKTSSQHSKFLADLNRFDPLTRFIAGLVIFMAGLLIFDQYFYWSTIPDYSFGYLVPMFAAYVIYDRWPNIFRYLIGEGEMPRGKSGSLLESLFNVLFWLGLFGSLMVFFMGSLIRAGQGPSNQGSLALAMGFGGIVIGFAYLCSERDTVGREYDLKQRLTFTLWFLFPALVWLISAPMVMYLDSTVKLYLLEWVTVIVYHVYDFLGFSLVREGNVLLMPKGRVGVADACSGIRSLTGCIFAGTFLAAVFLDRFWKKALLFVTACVLAFVMNIFRSLFLTGWAYHYGAGAIDDEVPIIGMSVHDIAGFSVLGLTVLFLLALLPLFTLTFAEDDEDDNGDDGTLPNAEPAHHS
ncbi:exosortase/archaeosortase family protein [Cerasicoccus arenae]|uniref:exosortase/archaeosortase family protein n=1 Tax=Cerasicoccus arenae TaxID=424488 RepID=UPI001677A35C|nr:exosortase/archaeosortase family protein [Cerasicoccus arenae]MBK1857370.1 exosortase/archaeosortase family protein [Cerasicoccus arenae]